MDSDHETEEEIVLLAPPSDEEFVDVAVAERAIRRYAMEHGYALSKKNEAFDKRKPPTVRRKDFRCAKGRSFTSNSLKRLTSTRMVDCPFEVRLIRSEYGTWRVQVKEGTHNHEPSSPETFSQFRKPSDDEKTLIRSLHASGSAPRFILAALTDRSPNCLVSLRDIYNECARAKKERLRMHTPIEALVEELDDDSWASHYTTDEQGHVSLLFFAPSEAIDLAQASPDVVFIDATYRTNRYNMPLIHFMTVTSIGKTVSTGMCFVAAENEIMYLRAVAIFKELVMGNRNIQIFLTDDDASLKNAIQAVYPNVKQLLCLWHVNKNVEKAVAENWRVNTSDQNNDENKQKRKDFLQAWNNVVYQHTEEEFECAYRLLKERYYDQRRLMDYLDEHKYPKRQEFAKAFTSKYQHFGHIATSRGESGHRHFKRFLLSSRHDLLELKDKWQVMLRVFLNDYRATLAQQRDRKYHDINAKRWECLDPELNNHIVPAAMRLFVRELNKANDSLVDKPCTNSFNTIYGILCYHSIRELQCLKIKITKQHFHAHWHFERVRETIGLPGPPPVPPGPVIFQPHVVRTRGRQRRDRTTRRDPSQWEIATSTGAAAPQRPGRVGGATSAALNSPRVSSIQAATPMAANSASSENAAAAAAVVSTALVTTNIIDSTHTTRQEHLSLDHCPLAEVAVEQSVCFTSVAQGTSAQQGVESTQPSTTTLCALQSAQAKKRGRPKGSKDRQPRKRRRTGGVADSSGGSTQAVFNLSDRSLPAS